MSENFKTIGVGSVGIIILSIILIFVSKNIILDIIGWVALVVGVFFGLVFLYFLLKNSNGQKPSGF